jgi:hypothetical protein
VATAAVPEPSEPALEVTEEEPPPPAPPVADPPPPPREPATPTAPGTAWPAGLEVGHAEGPALFAGTGQDAFPVAWVRAGTPVRIRGDVQGTRVRAWVDSALEVRGWLDLTRVEAAVRRRGRVQGTPIYVVPGDFVSVVGVREGRAVVQAVARLGRDELPYSAVYEGTLAFDALGRLEEGQVARGATPGRATRLRGRVTLYARPGGDAVLELPALNPPMVATVLRETPGWRGVRVGVGPYLLGFVPAEALEDPGPTPNKGAKQEDDYESYDLGVSEIMNPWARPGIPRPAEPRRGEASALPSRLREARRRPEHRVPRGVRVYVQGQLMARFREPGWAIEIDRSGDAVDVLCAVDDEVTVRGVVRAEDLRPVEDELGP